MIEKDLLIVYNIFGKQEDNNIYLRDLESIFWHLNNNPSTNNIRLVISAVLKDEETLKMLKENYGDTVKIFCYDTIRYPVQVTFNKTVLASISEFNEEYQGYMYIGAGLSLPKIDNLFDRILDKNNSGKIGIMHLAVEDGDSRCKNSEDDEIIELGKWYDAHCLIFNKELKDFYGVPMSDVHGSCCTEPCFSYTSYALRKIYLKLGNSLCQHNNHCDSTVPMINRFGQNYNKMLLICGFMWGRKFEDLLKDKEAIDSGLGFYPENNNVVCSTEWFPHKKEKYDENFLSLDERLKYGVKRNFFTNKKEVNYDEIKYNFYE